MAGGAENVPVDSAAQLPLLLRQAFQAATSDAPGPMHLDLQGSTGNVVTDDLPSRSLLVLTQIGLDGSDMSEHLVLLRPCQQVVLAPPDLAPKAVAPVCDMHDSGFGGIDLQPSLHEKRCDLSGSPWPFSFPSSLALVRERAGVRVVPMACKPPSP